MNERRAPWVLIGSLLFLVLAPGTVAGLIPFWMTGWRVEKPFLGASVLRVAGAAMVFLGLVSLLDSFARFVFVGLGTPAPVAPPKRLVVSGQYRHVRNPMYVAILVIVIGQSLVLGSVVLLQYAALLFLLFRMFVILYEEPKLGSQFGASYQMYRENVRRWWPRIMPWTATSWKRGETMKVATSPAPASLILLGYWNHGSGEACYPDPLRFVDSHWDEQERAMVAKYLRSGLYVGGEMGLSGCRVCGVPNGSTELSDGVFIWPEGLAHYVEAHGVRLPQRFVEHIHSRKSSLSMLPIDQRWWRAQVAIDPPRDKAVGVELELLPPWDRAKRWWQFWRR